MAPMLCCDVDEMSLGNCFKGKCFLLLGAL